LVVGVAALGFVEPSKIWATTAAASLTTLAVSHLCLEAGAGI